MDAGLIDTPLALPQVPQEKPQPHTWNVRPQAPTPAASTNHCHWTIDYALTLGLCSGVFGVCSQVLGSEGGEGERITQGLIDEPGEPH